MKKNQLFLSAVIFASIYCSTAIFAQVKLPAIISDNMVLQQNQNVALWGWAAPNEQVTIKPSWTKKSITTKADASGKWLVNIKTEKAGGPYSITFQASNSIEIKNVLLGEVWLAGGQSNMEFFMAKVEKSGSYNGEIHVAEETPLANFPNIRYIDIENKVADEPQADTKGNWIACSPQTVGSFSAVAYYFAKDIYQKTGLPIGIINSTWGGTPAESWTKKEILQADTALSPILTRYEQTVKAYPAAFATYKTELEKWRADTAKLKPSAPTEPIGPRSNKSPYKLYNGMIAPILPYTLKGVIWYQGENNAPYAFQYRKLFSTMINEWRTEFNNQNMPFYFVQISPHRSQNAEIRDAQLYVYNHVKNTGIVITTDNGDSLNIHPRNKKIVGERLALWARHFNYGEKDLTYTAPIYKSFKIEGNKIRIYFDHVEDGLKAEDNLIEFTIAGADKKFIPANAKVDGHSILVSAENVVNPTAVRFAWRNVPKPNLFSKSGLPVSPFRTDEWILETQFKR